MSKERALDGTLGASPGTYSWGWLIAADDSARICEATGGSTGPYEHFAYRFVDCDSGVEFALTANDPRHRWRPISREKLVSETGLDPGPFHDGNLNWQGAWFTKERRNPVMRGLYRFCLDELIACGSFELQSLLLIRDPETASSSPRFNTTREFASAVADRHDNDAAHDLAAAIKAQFAHDVRMALRCPAMTCGWEELTDFSRRGGRPVNLWSGRLGLTVRLDRLGQAAKLPRLLERCDELVVAARDEIAREREASIIEATGSHQVGLFDNYGQKARRVAPGAEQPSVIATKEADRQAALF